MQVIRTVLADDHRIFIEGLKTVLQKEVTGYRFDITGIANNGSELLNLLNRNTRKADLLILDLNLPDKDGLEVIHQIRYHRLDIKILALTSYDDPKIIKSAFKLGANGYILKNKAVDELFQAIHTVLTGQVFMGEGVILSDVPLPGRAQDRHPASNPAFFGDRFIRKYNLTRRELEVLHLVAQAMNNKEIAQRLFISDQTVSVHRKNIMRKLGVSNTAGLIKAAYDNSLL
jgi:DNA-binding NarL/FixJ family response regulator